MIPFQMYTEKWMLKWLKRILEGDISVSIDIVIIENNFKKHQLTSMNDYS